MKTVAATQLDADICNIVEPPVCGCHAGVGIHVVIPADWQTRIAAGQAILGCNYHHLDDSGLLLTVTDYAIARLLIPAVVSTLTPGQQAEVALLNVKIAQAVQVAQSRADSSAEPVLQ